MSGVICKNAVFDIFWVIGKVTYVLEVVFWQGDGCI